MEGIFIYLCTFYLILILQICLKNLENLSQSSKKETVANAEYDPC